MNNNTQKKPSLKAAEKESAKFLMEKMGLPKKELDEISTLYGVSAFQMMEVMQYSKYRFIQTDNMAG